MAASRTHFLLWNTLLFQCLQCYAEFTMYSSDSKTKLTEDNTRIDLAQGEIFPFFGQNYQSIYVSKDGLVGFSPSASYKIRKYSKNPELFTASVDYPFAASFHFDAVSTGGVIGGESYRGETLYKQLRPNSIDLGDMSYFVRAAFSGQDQFNATYGLVVTWKDVMDSYEQAVAQCVYKADSPDVCKTNTFQQVMLTDGVSSFAIFNYATMDLQTSTYTQSGFNGGYGRGWSEAIPSDLLQYANTGSGSDIPGRYIYQINDNIIYKGGCTKQTSKMEKLYIRQRYAGMFGGEMLDFNGPCLTPGDAILCRFGSGNDAIQTGGFFVNSMRGRCLVPKLLQRGRVKVAVSIDGGMHYYFETVVTIVHPSRMKHDVKFPSGDMSWYSMSAKTLSLTWEASSLTNDSSAVVDVNIVGYKETSEKAEWIPLLTVGQNIPVIQQSLSFNVDDLLCNDDCSSYEIGIVQVLLKNKTLALKRGYQTSGVIPLGFLMNKRMSQTYGSNWPHDKCIAWYNKDKQDTGWLNSLPSCPCNLQQALVDIGNWQSDLGCNLFSTRPANCHYHKEAVHCVRAVQPAMHNNDGAGNQCCYGADGQLVFSADSYQGSTPDRSHDWGAYPYVRPNYVPSMSHWLQDVITFYYCCLWTEYSDCDYYMDLRSTRDCVHYIPPKQAMVYGQSHVYTFDGSMYRVCGEGDFVLLESQELTIEGRFQKSPFDQSDRLNKSVILTDVGIKFGTDKVELRLKGPNVDRTKRLIDVLVNGEFIIFDESSVRWQDFTDCAIVNNMQISNPSTNKESNFTVISHDGIGIQVAQQDDMLNLLVFLPHKMKGNVKGLLGNWNGQQNDDFIPRGTSYSVQTTAPNIFFSEFMLSWALKEKKQSIVPFALIAKNDSTMCSTATRTANTGFCNNNLECAFDMWSTQNRTLAQHTRDLSNRYNEIERFVQPVRSCGLLNVPRSKKSSNNYTLGSTVSVTGCRTGTLEGRATYTCKAMNNNTQTWSPSVTATCKTAVESADIAMIIGIVIAVCVVLIIILSVIIIVLKRRRRKSGKSEGDNELGQSKQ